MDWLVIGYGNTLRGDDGVGPRVAEAVSRLELPAVAAIACGLLTPELAEPVSRARRAVFVDAAVDEPRKVRLRPLRPAPTAQIIAHSATPAVVLALAREVYGHAPEAWWLTIPAAQISVGESLSEFTQAKMLEALGRLLELMRSGGALQPGN